MEWNGKREEKGKKKFVNFIFLDYFYSRYYRRDWDE